MQMERGRVNNCTGYYYHYNFSQFCNNNNNNNNSYKYEDEEMADPLPISRDHGFLMSPTNNIYPLSSASSSPIHHDFIEHHVSRMDTLAGVAIKYGVEVADIKKMNGLVTDLQMFALKSLQIPLPGRHPPSPCLSNGHDTSRKQNPTYRVHSDLLDSFQSLRLNSSRGKVSPAMNSLQGYYGLKPITGPKISDSEMLDRRKGYLNHQEDVHYLKPSPASNTPLSRHRKSKSLLDGFLDENNGLADNQHSIENDSEKWNEKSVRRRQKSETDFASIHPEMLIREDNCGGVSSAISGKSLALRSNAASRTVSPIHSETGSLTESFLTGGCSTVRKSSSTSSLHDQESSGASIWTSLKPDLQALSAAAIARPIFDGLPKPMTSRRNKAALD